MQYRLPLMGGSKHLRSEENKRDKEFVFFIFRDASRGLTIERHSGEAPLVFQPGGNGCPFWGIPPIHGSSLGRERLLKTTILVKAKSLIAFLTSQNVALQGPGSRIRKRSDTQMAPFHVRPNRSAEWRLMFNAVNASMSAKRDFAFTAVSDLQLYLNGNIVIPNAFQDPT